MKHTCTNIKIYKLQAQKSDTLVLAAEQKNKTWVSTFNKAVSFFILMGIKYKIILKNIYKGIT